MRALAQKAEISSRRANGLRYAGLELFITPSGYNIFFFESLCIVCIAR